MPLADRDKALREHLRQLDGLVDRAAVSRSVGGRAFDQAVGQERPAGFTATFTPANLVVSNGRLSAVIDFGDLAVGDPAVDLSVAWIRPRCRRAPVFRASARVSRDPIDDETWMRARGWALALGLAYLARSGGDDGLRALAQTTIGAALNDSDL